MSLYFQSRRRCWVRSVRTSNFSNRFQPNMNCVYHKVLCRGPSTGQHSFSGTPTKRQVSKRQVSKRPVSKRLKRRVYKTSGLQNVRFAKRQVYKTSGLQNVRSAKRPVAKKHPYIYSVLVVGGDPQVLLQPCLLAK